jgi:16S rRNA (uracil1498-N3)-methyltransferase
MAGLFFDPDLAVASASVELTGEEARHAVAVRRIRAGETIGITNGAGQICQGRVEAVESRPPKLLVIIESCITQKSPCCIQLAAAVPKGDRQRTMIDMAVQAGMNSFSPLRCERSVSRASSNAVERWQKIALEAMKQSQRAWLPRINPETGLSGLLDNSIHDTTVLLASAEGKPVAELSLPGSAANIMILVGPEGGFTDAELDRITATGAHPLRLADGVLRTETAAVMAVGAVASVLRG